MLEIDETELIEFFGVLPSEQNPEEKEFFGTTIFDVHQDGLHLSISFSLYDDTCYLDLKTEQVEKPLLELRLKQVWEVRVLRDKPNSTPILQVKAQGASESKIDAGSVQVIQVRVQPRLHVRVRNWSEAT